MRLSTFKRNWMLHYVQPEYLYLPRRTGEKPEPIPTSFLYRLYLRIRFLYREGAAAATQVDLYLKGKYALKEKGTMTFFQAYITERYTAKINNSSQIFTFISFIPIKYTQADIRQNKVPALNILQDLYPQGTVKLGRYQDVILCFDKPYELEWYDVEAEKSKIHIDAINMVELREFSLDKLQQNQELNFMQNIYYAAYLVAIGEGLIKEYLPEAKVMNEQSEGLYDLKCGVNTYIEHVSETQIITSIYTGTSQNIDGRGTTLSELHRTQEYHMRGWNVDNNINIQNPTVNTFGTFRESPLAHYPSLVTSNELVQKEDEIFGYVGYTKDTVPEAIREMGISYWNLEEDGTEGLEFRKDYIEYISADVQDYSGDMVINVNIGQYQYSTDRADAYLKGSYSSGLFTGVDLITTPCYFDDQITDNLDPEYFVRDEEWDPTSPAFHYHYGESISSIGPAFQMTAKGPWIEESYLNNSGFAIKNVDLMTDKQVTKIIGGTGTGPLFHPNSPKITRQFGWCGVTDGYSIYATGRAYTESFYAVMSGGTPFSKGYIAKGDTELVTAGRYEETNTHDSFSLPQIYPDKNVASIILQSAFKDYLEEYKNNHNNSIVYDFTLEQMVYEFFRNQQITNDTTRNRLIAPYTTATLPPVSYYWYINTKRNSFTLQDFL